MSVVACPNRVDCERPGPRGDKVAAIVVTHRPDSGVATGLTRIAAQFAQLIVVDNHSDDKILGELQAFAARCENVLFVANAENVGVAAALNQGCRQAEERGAEWVVTFDQDSVPSVELLFCLADEWEQHPQRDRLGLVGVNFRTTSGRTLLREGTGLADARTVITSGSLLNLAAWRAVGPFREEFFIDEVDHEYSLRLRRAGWLVTVARRVLMDHDLGTPQRRHAWQPVLSHHSPVRRYYMVRNRILLAREYLGFDPRFVCGQLVRSLRESATIFLFEPEKAAKLRAMAKGLIDGIRGRAGRAAWHSP